MLIYLSASLFLLLTLIVLPMSLKILCSLSQHHSVNTSGGNSSISSASSASSSTPSTPMNRSHLFLYSDTESGSTHVAEKQAAIFNAAGSRRLISRLFHFCLPAPSTTSRSSRFVFASSALLPATWRKGLWGEVVVWRKYGVLITVYLLLLICLSLFASSPAYIRDTEVLWPLYHPEGPFSRSLREEFPDFTIVTFSSDGYTDPLENLIGSLHVWAKGVPIVVYDLGLSLANRKRIAAIDNVEIVYFNFSNYPKHVRFMNNYAFKPILLWDAVQRYGNILSLDAGIEVRSSLWQVFETIRTVGYFFVEASDVDPLTRIYPDTVTWLNMSDPKEKELQCYGGMHGYAQNSFAVQEILKPTYICSLDNRCIDPIGSGHENHRYDQAVFSLFIRKHRLHCNVGRMYNEHSPTTLHPDPLASHQPQVFFFRRWRYPKPYVAYVARRPIISDRQSDNNGDQLIDRDSDRSLASSGENSSIFENGITDRKTSDNKLLQCLREHNYNLEQCHKEKNEWSMLSSKKEMLGSAALREREEMRGYALGLAAKVFWYWPFSIGLASFIISASALLYLLHCHWQYRHVTITALGLLFVFLVAHHIGTPQFCRELGKVYFNLESEDSLIMSRKTVECQGSNSRISFSVSPIFLNHGDYERYAFFEASVHDMGFIYYAVPSLGDRSTGWMYMGIAVMDPYVLQQPCFFEEGGQMFMLPQTPTLQRILLYTTLALPRGWHVVRDLLSFVAPVSSKLYRTSDGWWYLSVHHDDDRTAMYRSASLLRDDFVVVSQREAPLLGEYNAVCNQNPVLRL